MPCMGPEVNDEHVVQATNEIMELLRNKYELQPNDFITRKNGLYFCGWQAGQQAEARERVNTQLKEAVKALFMQQACEDF
jgi:hypothetical protein